MMEHYFNKLGGEEWFDYEGVYLEMVTRFGDGAVFVELGSWKGKSSVFMAVEIANSEKDIEFVCIDNWSQGETKKEFLRNIEPVKEYITLCEGISWDMARIFDDETVDFCFVDAAHDYSSKVNDIEHWLPKIKKGGVIAGHDYNEDLQIHTDVARAVNDCLGKKNIRIIKNVWIYEKP